MISACEASASSSPEEARPLLAAKGRQRSRIDADRHELPESELVVDCDSRPPVSYQLRHMLDQLEERGYFALTEAAAVPATPQCGERRCGQGRVRTPLYVTATIIRIADIKASESTFTLRVRLHLMWEEDLRALGLREKVEAERAASSNPFYITSDSPLMEEVLKAGVVVPAIKFMNSVSSVDADQPMMRVYPRPTDAELEMIYWNQMWDVTFRHDFQLEAFPFDSQTLRMELNLSDSTTFDLFHLVVHAVQVRTTVLELHEWRLHVPRISRGTPKHRVVNIDVRVSRKPGYYLWNIVFILCSISCLIFTAFVGHWEDTQDRVSIALTLILTSVAFKFTLNESMPKLNYQTLLDKYMLHTQVSLCAVTLALCAARVLDNCKRHLHVERLSWLDAHSFDRWMLELSLISYAAAQVHWFARAYASYRQELGETLHRGNFQRLDPATGKVQPQQWLCFHFARTFFLPEHQSPPEAFDGEAWSSGA